MDCVTRRPSRRNSPLTHTPCVQIDVMYTDGEVLASAHLVKVVPRNGER
jgi:hypothetical protein